eukprot:359094-Chlamydomonas_euryale.AAC.15
MKAWCISASFPGPAILLSRENRGTPLLEAEPFPASCFMLRPGNSAPNISAQHAVGGIAKWGRGSCKGRRARHARDAPSPAAAVTALVSAVCQHLQSAGRCFLLFCLPIMASPTTLATIDHVVLLLLNCTLLAVTILSLVLLVLVLLLVLIIVQALL